MLRRTLVAALLVATLPGCSAGTAVFGPSTGTVTGHVQIRACGGAYRPGQASCPSNPDAGVTLTFQPASPAGNATQKTVTSDANGSYRIVLAPGTYTVRATGPAATVQAASGAFVGPRQIVVTDGKTVTADFVYTIELL
jgi:hypothetical protein